MNYKDIIDTNGRWVVGNGQLINTLDDLRTPELGKLLLWYEAKQRQL